MNIIGQKRYTMIYCKGFDFVTYDILMYWTDVKKLLPMRNYPGWEWFHWTFLDKPHFHQWSGGEWKWPITELVDDTKTGGNCKQRCSHSQQLRSQTKCTLIYVHSCTTTSQIQDYIYKSDALDKDLWVVRAMQLPMHSQDDATGTSKVILRC